MRTWGPSCCLINTIFYYSSYSITSEEDYFAIDPVTGVISLKKEFIRSQTESKYIFKVQAKDSGLKNLSSESTVVIPVINKDQPMFSNNYYGTVSEDAQPGRVIMKVAAKGRDNRQVYYEISGGDEYELFNVGFTTGMFISMGKRKKKRIFRILISGRNHSVRISSCYLS